VLTVEFITPASLVGLPLSPATEDEGLDFAFFEDSVDLMPDWETLPEPDEAGRPVEALRGLGGMLYPLWVRQCSSYSFCISGSAYLILAGCPSAELSTKKYRITLIFHDTLNLMCMYIIP